MSTEEQTDQTVRTDQTGELVHELMMHALDVQIAYKQGSSGRVLARLDELVALVGEVRDQLQQAS